MRESGYYPPGAEYDPNAPWNEKENEEIEFDIFVSQTLSKSTKISTSNYAKVTTVEPENNLYEEYVDITNTDFEQEFKENGHYTPLQLIHTLKDLLESKMETFSKSEQAKWKHVLKECEDWVEDDIEIMEEV